MSTEISSTNYREFLRNRYEQLKLSKPAFSARYFAKKAGVRSISYFRMVVSGERKLSAEYARKFGKGLSLSSLELKLLLKTVELEQTSEPAMRQDLLCEIKALTRQQGTHVQTLKASHVEILSDLRNLKLYLLAQSKNFQTDAAWISKRFHGKLTDEEIAKRIRLLLESGLWKIENGEVRTLAPVVRTGDCLEEHHLAQTHWNILEAAKRAIHSQATNHRILSGRTFLFDKKRLAEVSERIEQFKAEIEAEFEDLNAEDVYELHLSFFEIKGEE